LVLTPAKRCRDKYLHGIFKKAKWILELLKLNFYLIQGEKSQAGISALDASPYF